MAHIRSKTRLSFDCSTFQHVWATDLFPRPFNSSYWPHSLLYIILVVFQYLLSIFNISTIYKFKHIIICLNFIENVTNINVLITRIHNCLVQLSTIYEPLRSSTKYIAVGYLVKFNFNYCDISFIVTLLLTSQRSVYNNRYYHYNRYSSNSHLMIL